MNNIALILCSFNNKLDTLKCIESIFRSSIHNFDLIVVDNASDDGTSGEIYNKYNDKIHLISNLENTGAGAGFNTGIKYALTKQYEYIMTVDHDVLFENDTIKVLYDFLSKNNDVGVAGSKFCYMDKPNIIQWYGLNIDYELFRFVSKYANYEDNDTIPDVLYCDGAILGAMMIRKECIDKAGLLDESYYIYNEDIDWCYRIRKAGYKIAVCSASKVLHRFGLTARQSKNTFGTYYHRRNIFKVMLKILPDNLVTAFCEFTFKELFDGLYSCNYLSKYNAMKTLTYSLEDALSNNFGKAGDGRILKLDDIENRLRLVIKNYDSIVLKCTDAVNSKLKKTRKLITDIKKINSTANIYLHTNDDELINNILDIPFINDIEINSLRKHIVLNMCEHIFRIKELDNNQIYIDSFLNIVSDDNDRQYCLRYDVSYEFFHRAYFHIMFSKAMELRKCI